MPPTLRVDWFRVLVDLEHAGFPNCDVADQIGKARTTLVSWKDGCEPRHADGEKLLTFWSSATGKSRQDVPRVPDMPSAHDRRS